MFTISLKNSAAFAGLFLTLSLATVSGRAGETPSVLPPELTLIPRDAAGFVTVRVADLWKAKAFGQMRYVLQPDGGDLKDDFQAYYGTAIEGIERATVVWPTGEHTGWDILEVPDDLPSRLLIVTTKKPMTTQPNAAELKRARRHRGFSYFQDQDEWTCIHYPNDRTMVIGSRAAMIWLLDHRARPQDQGPLTAAIASTRTDALICLGIQPKHFKDLLTRWYPGIAEALPPARDAELLTAVMREGQRLEILGRIEYRTKDAALKAFAVLGPWGKAYAADQRTKWKETEDWVEKNKADDSAKRKPGESSWKAIIQFYRDMAAAFESLRLQEETSVGFRLRTDEFASITTEPYSFVPYMTLPSGPRLWSSKENLNQTGTVARVLEKYHEIHGHYPPPAIYSKDGKPLLSWRVALLPILGEEGKKLYGRFKLDEPWDSPTNKRLLREIPNMFATSRPTSQNYRPRPGTTYRIVVGAGTMFEGPAGISRKDVKDDPAQTILVIRGGYGTTPWTSPEEPRLKDGKAPPLSDDTIEAAIFADGSVRVVNLSDLAKIHAGLTRAGGEKVVFSSKVP